MTKITNTFRHGIETITSKLHYVFFRVFSNKFSADNSTYGKSDGKFISLNYPDASCHVQFIIRLNLIYVIE